MNDNLIMPPYWEAHQIDIVLICRLLYIATYKMQLNINDLQSLGNVFQAIVMHFTFSNCKLLQIVC